MSEISNFKRKRQEREALFAKEKRDARIQKIGLIAGCAAFATCVIGAFAFTSHQAANAYYPLTEFSAFNDENGYLKNVDSENLMPADFDLADIEVDEKLVQYTEDEADAAIDTKQRENSTLSEDSSHEIVSGDEINLDYSGTIDGKAFDGGNAEDELLTIGSGSFIEGFEDQLIGAHPGDDVTVNVTFPEDYGVDELNGKDAVFECHINGYSVPADLTEDFIKEQTDGKAATEEEYKQYLIETNSNSRLDNEVEEWLLEKSSITSYPKKYLHHLEEYVMYLDQVDYQQNMELYQMYGIDFPYASYEEYQAAAYEDYEAHRLEEAQKLASQNVYFDYIAKANHITVSDEAYQKFIADNSITEDAIQYFGEPFLHQEALHQAVLEFLRDKVTVTDIPDEEPEEEAELELAEPEDAAAVEASEIDVEDAAETESADVPTDAEQ